MNATNGSELRESRTKLALYDQLIVCFRVQKLYARCQRGFLSYKGMEAPELQLYIA